MSETVLTYPSMFSLLSDKSVFQDGKVYATLSFYTGKNTGDGSYVYMSSVNKATANGGSIIDPDKMGTLTSTNVQTQLVDYLKKQGTGVGTGCLVRIGVEHTAEMYGGLPNIPTFDCTPCFKKIIATIQAPVIRLLEGTYYVKSKVGKSPAINMPNNSVVKGAGMYNSYLKNMDDAPIVSIPIGSYGTQYTTVQDFGVDGNRQRLGGVFYNEGEGIDFGKGSKNHIIKNIHIKETNGEAIDIDGSEDVYIDNMYIENCSGNGLHISDGQPPRYCNVSNVTVINCAHGRGRSGDARSAGVLLRVSSLNVTNLIIKDCWIGILQNGTLVSKDKKEHTNITNLHISGSANQDIVVTADASGMNITNFIIKRAATNVYPTTIKADIGKSFMLSNGDIEAAAHIYIAGNATSGRRGATLNNIIAPSCTIEVRSFGRGAEPWSYVSIGNGCVFSNMTLSALYGFKVSGVTCDNINLAGQSLNGIISGNIVTQNIMTDTAVDALRNIMITNNRVGVAVAPVLVNNIYCLTIENLVG
ncbi:right-handed parallel beta-helix repeat-containing protein [Psychrobacter urativorans]|uniref:Right handed beta helix domain-containing protein n=1 Tax=Psychrobacter urativorans TaxID=45610 RepID=A0A0M4TW90_9GAMM|nr:right-handed parallel beta-helix repeat-containing protein [Psychrobacter urativorans]ALF60436.1 hypothetical protein AOC03_10620 [Psychrobacter urativorans]